MGIFARVKEMTSADMHHLLDRMEDPIPMAKQYIRQVEEQREQVQQALIQQQYTGQQLDLLIAGSRALVQKRQRQAELAVERDEENMAEIALQDKLHHLRLLQDYEDRRQAIREQGDKLRDVLVRLSDLHLDLNNRLAFQMSRLHAAEVSRSAEAVLRDLDTGRIIRGFDRVEQKLGSLDTRWADRRSYDGKLTDTDASSRLDAFEIQASIKAELQSIKSAIAAK
ncbi:PspA/IM30 family protein [Paenibacillus lemnae]|uniref:PspA/IM30 family protein n=1 Tax=Paenibacillus lemnae TaxID=1330551 RepID=A0A848M9R9_PAELE|nr:PspA/IM30 family protein [Paenibacillus lemnae]NMO97346.1 PspA/IM30 family protein [Paenibacillus lemnae]